MKSRLIVLPLQRLPLLVSLLDVDRFCGKFRDGAHKVDVTDLMRRMVKDDPLKFDGTPLFPERRAYTVNYKLSNLEAALYSAVTVYVKEQLHKADQGRAVGSRAAPGVTPSGFVHSTLARRSGSLFIRTPIA